MNGNQRIAALLSEPLPLVPAPQPESDQPFAWLFWRYPRVTLPMVRDSLIVGRRPVDAARAPSRDSPVTAIDGEHQYIGIRNHTLARSHFRIVRRLVPETGEVVFLVCDLASHCGTPINNVRVESDWTPLSHGDVLMFNELAMEFRLVVP